MPVAGLSQSDAAPDSGIRCTINTLLKLYFLRTNFAEDPFILSFVLSGRWKSRKASAEFSRFCEIWTEKVIPSMGSERKSLSGIMSASNDGGLQTSILASREITR
jgi:hypothetical protein